MRFEVKIEGNEVWTLGAAGIEMKAYQDLDFKVITGKAKLPATVTCPYFLSEKPVEVQITVLARKHFEIEVANAGIAKSIQEEIKRFDPLSYGAAGDRADKELRARIGKILNLDGLSLEDVQARKATLSRRTQEGLMKLCEEVHFAHSYSLYWPFVHSKIPKEDRVFVARWLFDRLAVEKCPGTRNNIETVFLNNRDLTVRELAEEAARLIKNPRLGVSRSAMSYYLTKLKHPQAAELIASVMDGENMAWSSLRCIGDLKAKQYEPHVRKYLRDPDSEIRLEAKRALKKMGCDVGKAPPPIHLVKGKKSMPKGLEEWSANLDFETLEPVLKSLAGCVHDGFGSQEVAEILGVAEETKPEQTKAFRFVVNGGMNELWVAVFMDDINSPDLYVHGHPGLIKKFAATVDLPE